MYRLTLRFFTAMQIAALIVSACSFDDDKVEKGTLHFSFNIVSDSGDGTKSSISASDDLVKTVDLFIFDVKSGIQMQRCSFTAGDDYETAGLAKGREYIVYALANCGECNPLSKAAAEDLSVSVNNLNNISSNGLPMAGTSAEFSFNDDTGAIEIPLSRLMSKIALSINTEGMNGSFAIKSVTLNNVPEIVYPFRKQSAAGSGDVTEGDRASEIDISRLNGGSSIVLLSGENMHGVLLPGNTDPWSKVPENIPQDGDCCTYLSVTGDYSNGGLSVNDVCYKMYLGENSTDNFNLQRNCIYNITLTLSDEAAVLASSWKVERGVTQDCRQLAFDVTTDTLTQFSSSRRTIVCLPQEFDFDIIEGDGFKEAGLTFTRNGDGSISVSSKAITGKSVTGRLYAKSWDRGKSAWCDFTVMNWDTIVRVNNGQPLVMWKGDTVTFGATVHYENGNVTENITGTAQWSCSGSAGSIIGSSDDGKQLKFLGNAIGTNTLTASYCGRSQSVRAVVSTTKAVILEPKDTTIRVGDTLALRAKVVFNSGDTVVYNPQFDFMTSGIDVICKTGLKTDKVVAKKAGTSQVLAILKRDNQYTDSCKVTVIL